MTGVKTAVVMSTHSDTQHTQQNYVFFHPFPHKNKASLHGGKGY